VDSPAAWRLAPWPEHMFAVNDANGLLLACTAPEIDTDIETDVFNGCTLAPGRTLDDVMHTLVQGNHFERNRHKMEREEWQKNLEAGPEQKPTEKK
jgi:hypothetical protein